MSDGSDTNAPGPDDLAPGGASDSQDEALPIRFLAMPGFEPGQCPQPTPARQALPDWFAQMPSQAPPPPPDLETVKKCPPFLEAMSAGYVLPVPDDLAMRIAPTGSIEIKAKRKLIGAHPPSQFPGAPFGAGPALKFLNPWVIKTPPGYSCLFTSPLNHVGRPFEPLAGVVETDRYEGPVAFPCRVHWRGAEWIEIPAGTPMVQVIPFRRQAWRAEFGARNEQAVTEVRESIKREKGYYRRVAWEGKAYR
ncbi:MAG: DUF6065 family protein [Planctomycetota bacterium]